MSRFLDELAKVCATSYDKNVGTPLLSYVKRGDEVALEQAQKQAGPNSWSLYWLDPVWSHLAEPCELSEEEKRAMHAAVVLGQADDLAEWLKSRLVKQPADEDGYLRAYLEAFGTGKLDRTKAATAIMHPGGECLERRDGQPNAAGLFLLALSDAELAAAASRATLVSAPLAFLLKHAPQRVPAVAAAFVCEGSDTYRAVSKACCRLLLDHDAKTYEAVVARAADAEKRVGEKARALALLADHFAERYLAAAQAANLAVIKPARGSYNDQTLAFAWLLGTFGAAMLPEFESYFSTGRARHSEGAYKESLQRLATDLGESGASAVVAAIKHESHAIRLEAIAILIGWNNPAYDDVIGKNLEAGLATDDNDMVVRYIGLVARWQPQRLAAPLWKLFEHKSKPVRTAAARALGRLGDEAVRKASELLAAKKATARSAAVTLLAAAQTPAAATALEARLDAETDEEVRDQILLALDKVWESQGKKITRREIDERIERTAAKLAAPVAAWVNEKQLPPLAYTKKGEKLLPQVVRYLLYRQSRAKQMRADVECKPLYALIDRNGSGDFALAIVKMFLGSKMAADDRWALAVAGLLGDDRIVPVLMQQIRQWVDSGRGKLAEYAAEALALLCTDTALCAVDSLSIRYRSKQKNIGKAASEAFAEAAERAGVTVDELGDLVVPWLGFAPGQPRLVEQGDKRIEVRIGLDSKIEFRDLAKGKRITSLPAGVPAAVKAEFKDLAATLREVLKGQLARLENLMVRQFRWPVARWRKLFLAHPVLFPFAARLVWGIYTEGRLTATFRALEDRSLTDVRDESVALPADDTAGATVGIVHPLELEPEEREAWAVHLADYKVQSPFLQMERRVVYPAADEQAVKISAKYNGTELNAMTFKGRADRLGWQRGSVCDGGGITCYRKGFPGANADAILGVDGMYIGIDMESSVKLQQLCFVRAGSVSFGSYEYDEPANDQDPRLIAFHAVPPIVFSETLGDLAKIAGQKESAEAE